MPKRDTVVRSTLQQLRHLMETEYGIGDRLPTEKQLAEQLEVSRGTIREALGALSSEGAVTRQWGIGTFVSPPRTAASLSMSAIQSYRDRVQASGHAVSLRDATCTLEHASDDAVTALGLELGATAWRLFRLFAVDGVPSAYMVEYIPTELFGTPIDPHAVLSIKTDLFDMLNRHDGVTVASTVTDINAIVVDAHHATALGIATGEPVLRTEQVTFGPDGQPLAYGTTLQRTDLVRMRITRQNSREWVSSRPSPHANMPNSSGNWTLGSPLSRSKLAL